MQAIVDALHVVEGRPVTSSRIVSEYFEKKHSDVVRAIEAISTKKPELVASRNFAQWSEQVEIGSGAKRTVTGYWMDRKGFCLLAMGFTGSKALEFKCAFYDEFDRMEKALSGESGPDFIDEAQQREIQRAVGRRAAGIGKNFSLIYGALKDRFDIPRYTCLQKKDFEAAIAFIQTVPIKTRAEWVKHEQEEIKRIESTTYHDEQIPPKYYTVKAHFMEELRSLVYTWRYLHRANLERYVDFLRSVDSPYAASMWEAVHDFNWASLEASLDKIGYSVKELPCYKHWPEPSGSVINEFPSL